MQVDRASRRTSNKLTIPENIRLILQTSLSPELNPVEHLWEAIRENYFYNQDQFFMKLQQMAER